MNAEGTGSGPRLDSGSPRSEASVGELIGQVSRDLSALIRQELALARAEAQQTARRVGAGAGLLAGAAWAVQMLLLFASLALWWALGMVFGESPSAPDLALAGLAVAGLWAVVAAVLALVGRRRLTQATGLPQTAETLQKIPPALKGHQTP